MNIQTVPRQDMGNAMQQITQDTQQQHQVLHPVQVIHNSIIPQQPQQQISHMYQHQELQMQQPQKTQEAYSHLT